jgi:hypothetical protein
MFTFKKAERKKSKLRLAVCGPSGSGKTYGALLIAKGMGGRIAVIDTEHGSASLYTDICDFDTIELEAPYSPERYIAAIKAAEKEGYETLIVDSTTHEWSGSGGCLEMNDEIAKAKYRGNTWSAWNETTPRHRKFIDAMLQSPMHIIATGRSKTETAQEEQNGRKRVVKLGMKTEQREGFEYEFTVVLDIVHDGHYALASKDRTGLFKENPFKITEDTGKELISFLNSGVMVEAPVILEDLDMDKRVEESLESVRQSKTMEELRDNFLSSTRHWKNDDAMVSKLTSVKNSRKAELEALLNDAKEVFGDDVNFVDQKEAA